jgi:hypothetical protein
MASEGWVRTENEVTYTATPVVAANILVLSDDPYYAHVVYLHPNCE